MDGLANGQARGQEMVELKRLLFNFAVGLAVAGLEPGPVRAASTPLYLTGSTNPPTDASAVRLGWQPSPSPGAAGYRLCWGYGTGLATNQLDAGNVTNVTVAGMTTNTTYCFTVVTYGAMGEESPPSNEVQYVAASGRAAGPTLSLRRQRVGTNVSAVALSFQGSAGSSYRIQATEDWRTWVTVWLTNCTGEAAIEYAVAGDMRNYPQRFYRVLESSRGHSGPRLSAQVHRLGTNAPALVLSFQGSAGMSYLIEATQDLRTWATVCTTNCGAEGVIAYTAAGDLQNYPQRFYRVIER